MFHVEHFLGRTFDGKQCDFRVGNQACLCQESCRTPETFIRAGERSLTGSLER